jgi:hypothetical protein
MVPRLSVSSLAFERPQQAGVRSNRAKAIWVIVGRFFFVFRGGSDLEVVSAAAQVLWTEYRNKTTYFETGGPTHRPARVENRKQTLNPTKSWVAWSFVHSV